jgi:hypothetical protein
LSPSSGWKYRWYPPARPHGVSTQKVTIWTHFAWSSKNFKFVENQPKLSVLESRYIIKI